MDVVDDDDGREGIITASLDLVERLGRHAASTRAVSAAAGVQVPTIYRLFGDKQGLLDAVTARGLEDYLSDKASASATADPVEDLRRGWDDHVSYAIAHPALYSLMYDGRERGIPSPAIAAAWDMLASLIRRIAQSGRLRVSELHATQLVHAAGMGTALTLIALPPGDRDDVLSRLAREAVVAAITHDAPRPVESGVATAAIALNASLSQTDALTATERHLLAEWLRRIIDDESHSR
ncbi:TetR/AcrR family transcriptional regulator [soil metagenome]